MPAYLIKKKYIGATNFTQKINYKDQKMTLKALTLYDRILVKKDGEESVSAGGIVIPGTAQEKPTTGQIVAVGKGKLLMDGSTATPLVKVGDTIMFSKHAGCEVKVGDDKFTVMREDDVLCVVVDQ